ncbi:7626_t:CDS:1, partial [Cetraspora pellucida]
LRSIVPKALNSVDVIMIRKHARRASWYMDAYRKELSLAAAKFAIKKYKSHKRIPESIIP